MHKRSVVFFLVLSVLFCGIAARYLSLAGPQAAAAAAEQGSATVTVATARGTVYDRNGSPLVNTGRETRYSIAPYPLTLSRLAALLPDTAFDTLSARLQGGRPVVAIADEDLSAVPGVLRFTVPVRQGAPLAAPHLVGYVDGNGQGAVGVEKAYDSYLAACSGQVRVTYAVNAVGGVLADQTPQVENTLYRTQGGVVLTVDKAIQQYAESVAAAYLKKGVVLILDADSSQVLADVSVPTFQPDTVADCLNAADSPLLDRTLSNYNCGSVFKIVSAAAALEAGVSVGRVYTCAGSVTVDGVVFHCHNRLGHGSLTMQEAMERSCNCYFIQLMQEVGAEALYAMAADLGFDRAIFPAENYKTARAVMPSRETLVSSRAALANFSFGQGELLATPFHLAQLVATVVQEGEIHRPSVVAALADVNGAVEPVAETPPQTAFSAETARVLKNMLVSAVEAEGATGTAARPLNGSAGGKTGTAESGWSTDTGTQVQNWFVGFYPAESPRYVVTVLAEDSGTTHCSAAEVFRRLCDGLYSFSLD